MMPTCGCEVGYYDDGISNDCISKQNILYVIL